MDSYQSPDEELRKRRQMIQGFVRRTATRKTKAPGVPGVTPSGAKPPKVVGGLGVSIPAGLQAKKPGWTGRTPTV